MRFRRQGAGVYRLAHVFKGVPVRDCEALLFHRHPRPMFCHGLGRSGRRFTVRIASTPTRPAETPDGGRSGALPRRATQVLPLNLVDALLHSLAEHEGEQAIGVVLSGAGSD
jgi:hypothetical protein